MRKLQKTIYQEIYDQLNSINDKNKKLGRKPDNVYICIKYYSYRDSTR